MIELQVGRQVRWIYIHSSMPTLGPEAHFSVLNTHWTHHVFSASKWWVVSTKALDLDDMSFMHDLVPVLFSHLCNCWNPGCTSNLIYLVAHIHLLSPFCLVQLLWSAKYYCQYSRVNIFTQSICSLHANTVRTAKLQVADEYNYVLDYNNLTWSQGQCTASLIGQQATWPECAHALYCIFCEGHCLGYHCVIALSL